jgi:ABC-type multidrug transport system ATPase subunit
LELVYLWVKGYKNIEKQGFNFSPRFEFEYIQEKNELILKKENKDYVSIFPKNINITAIVGENGSGKSSLLISILENILHDISLSNFLSHKSNVVLCRLFTIYYDNEKYYCLPTKMETPQCVDSLMELKKNIFSIYYNYSLTQIESVYGNKLYSNEFYTEIARSFNYSIVGNSAHTPILAQTNIARNFSYSIASKSAHAPILVQPDKFNTVHANMRKEIDNLIYFYHDEQIVFDDVQSFYIPKYYKLKYDFKTIWNINNLEFNRRYLEEKNPLKKKFDSEYNSHWKELADLKKEDYIFLTKLYIINQIVSNFLDDSAYKTVYGHYFSQYLGMIDRTDELLNILDGSYDSVFNKEIDYIRKSFEFIKFIKSQNDDFALDENKHSLNYELLSKLPHWIDIELFDRNEITISSLSYGQKFLINFLYNILYQLKTLKNYHSCRGVNLLFDEIELGLHPNWQKKFIAMLVNLLGSYNKKIKNYFQFNIVTSSHSPFLLSDLPKENVIFLKNGKQEYPFENGQTFGANIHTLLSHGFFMQDGLMGEFAKEKIEELVNFLQDKKSKIKNHEEALKIINIIGEPVLKMKLQRMLEDYKKKHNLESEEDIKKQIAQLQAKLEEKQNNG